MMSDRADTNTGVFWCPYCKIDTAGNHEAHCPHNYQKQRDTAIFYGAWECPRCRRINAPWMSHCDCSVPTGFGLTGDIQVLPTISSSSGLIRREYFAGPSTHILYTTREEIEKAISSMGSE